MQWLMIPFVILTGVLNGAQAGANAQLSKSLGDPVAAAFVVYAGGLLTFLVLAPFMGFSPATYLKLRHTPWWAMIGGVGGALFIVAMLTTADKLGTGAFIGLTVTSATLISIAIDHFGWLGVEPHPAGLWRLVGGALMIAGVALVAIF